MFLTEIKRFKINIPGTVKRLPVLFRRTPNGAVVRVIRVINLRIETGTSSISSSRRLADRATPPQN